jgi:hypothetical protein
MSDPTQERLRSPAMEIVRLALGSETVRRPAPESSATARSVQWWIGLCDE